MSNPENNIQQTDKTTHKGWKSRGYLPHIEIPGLLQFITFRLIDSIPEKQIERYKQNLQWNKALAQKSKKAVIYRKMVEEYEDMGKGSCYLKDDRIAEIAQKALLHFDGEKYRLICWCIMPNHIHV